MSEAPRLKTKYIEEIVPALKEQFGHTNIHTVPKLEKIVVNMGVGEAALVATGVGDGDNLVGAGETKATGGDGFPGACDVHHVGAGGFVVEEAGLELGFDPFDIGPGSDFVDLGVGDLMESFPNRERFQEERRYKRKKERGESVLQQPTEKQLVDGSCFAGYY